MGELFISVSGGEPMRLGDTIEVSMDNIEVSDDEPVIDISALRDTYELTIECGPIDPRAKLYIFTGIWPSNNWLKMHGGVLQRKVHKR